MCVCIVCAAKQAHGQQSSCGTSPHNSTTPSTPQHATNLPSQTCHAPPNLAQTHMAGGQQGRQAASQQRWRALEPAHQRPMRPHPTTPGPRPRLPATKSPDFSCVLACHQGQGRDCLCSPPNSPMIGKPGSSEKEWLKLKAHRQSESRFAGAPEAAAKPAKTQRMGVVWPRMCGNSLHCCRRPSSLVSDSRCWRAEAGSCCGGAWLRPPSTVSVPAAGQQWPGCGVAAARAPLGPECGACWGACIHTRWVDVDTKPFC